MLQYPQTGRMLLTVYADRLLLSQHAQTCHVGCNHAALAFQFLDYPLLVLRARGEAEQGTLEFKKGKAACVEADASELRFLLDHVTTSVLLLDTSHQPQPKLLATGQITLQNLQNLQETLPQAVHRQNVVLRDATQQPVACAEVYASLQPGSSLPPTAQQPPAATTQAKQLSQVPGSCVPQPMPLSLPENNQLIGTADDSAQLQSLCPSDLMQPTAWANLQFPGHLHSSTHNLNHQSLLQQPCLQQAAHVNLNGFQTHSLGRQQRPPGWFQQTHPVSNNSVLPVVLHHQQLSNEDAPLLKASSSSQQLINKGQKAQNIKDKTKPKKSNKPALHSAGANIVHAAALRATRILQGSKHAAAEAASGFSKRDNSRSRDPDVWSPPPPKPQRRECDKPNRQSIEATKFVKHISNQAATHQRRERLQGLKQQQLQYWQSSLQQQQQQQDVEQCKHCRADINREDSESDDCLEVEDISCSLSVVLQQEEQDFGAPQMNHAVRKFLVTHAPAAAPAAAAAAVTDKGAATNCQQKADTLQSNAGMDLEQLQVSTQPTIQADKLCLDHQPPAVALTQQCQQQQQQQQQQQEEEEELHHCCGHLHAVPAATLTSSTCHNCAATLSVAAQLLQATQQQAAHTCPAAAPAGSQCVAAAAASRPQQQQQQQQLFQGGVSAATAVVWELMTLMSVRAVMSQAINSMAGQLSTAVGQMIQQAMGNLYQRTIHTAAAAPSVAMPAAAAAAAAAWQVNEAQQDSSLQGVVSSVGAACGAKPGDVAFGTSAVPPQQHSSAAIAGDQQQLLMQQQLQQQQEELQRQFEQLETLMVVRNDSSSSSSGGSSSSSDIYYRRLQRDNSSRSSRGSRDSGVRCSSGSPASVEQYRDSRGVTDTDGEAAAAAAAAAAVTSSVSNGLIFRLKRSSTSSRRDQPTNRLSRTTSVAAAAVTPSVVSEGHTQAGDGTPRAAAAAAAAIASPGAERQTKSTVAANSGWLNLGGVTPAGVKEDTAAAAADGGGGGAVVSRNPLPFTLPPLSPPRSADGGVSNRLSFSAAGSGSLISRRKLSVASVDTSYSEVYDEDFESAASSMAGSPKAVHIDIPLAAAAAASGHSNSSSRLPNTGTAVVKSPASKVPSPSSPNQLTATSPSARAAGSSSSGAARQRLSFKLDRRGNELPEIPEISEDIDSLEADLKSLGLGKLSSMREQRQQQQQVGNSDGVVSADALDSLTASILEELLPPGSRSLSRKNSSSVNATSLSGSQDFVAAAAGESRGAEARIMSAALPSSVRRAVLRPLPAAAAAIPAAVGLTAARGGMASGVNEHHAQVYSSSSNPVISTSTQAGSSSTAKPYQVHHPQQQQQQQQQLEAVSSFVSVNSSLDDLLGSADLAMFSAPSKTSGDVTTAGPERGIATSASNDTKTTAVDGAISRTQQQQQQQLIVISSAHLAGTESARETSNKQQTKGYSSAAPRASTYSDVSFLSDEEEETAAAAAGAATTGTKQQVGERASARRTESGISYMSSLGDSDSDIDFSEETTAPQQLQPPRRLDLMAPSAAAAAAAAADKHRMPESHSAISNTSGPTQSARRAATADDGQLHRSTASTELGTDVHHKAADAGLRPQSVPAAAAAGSNGTGKAATSASRGSAAVRNAADVFYSHVSGTPAWSPAQQYGRTEHVASADCRR